MPADEALQETRMALHHRTCDAGRIELQLAGTLQMAITGRGTGS
jgi:hypothetical protein